MSPLNFAVTCTPSGHCAEESGSPRSLTPRLPVARSWWVMDRHLSSTHQLHLHHTPHTTHHTPHHTPHHHHHQIRFLLLLLRILLNPPPPPPPPPPPLLPPPPPPHTHTATTELFEVAEPGRSTELAVVTASAEACRVAPADRAATAGESQRSLKFHL